MSGMDNKNSIEKQLPKGWEVKMFIECIKTIKKTSKIPKKSFLKEGEYPIVSQEAGLVNGFWNNHKDVLKVTKPIVIFGDHTKIIKYIDFDFVLGADGVKLFLPIDSLNSKFFAYQLRSIKLKNLGYARHFRLLKERNIVIPPLSEQQRIVNILDQAFADIQKAQANIEQNIINAKELFQSKLNEIFEQRGEGWEEKSLGEVCEMVKRGVAPKYTEKTNALTVINQKCIRDHKINLKLARKHDESIKRINPERLLQFGDVLVNSTGTGTLGRIAQVRDTLHVGCMVDTHITIVRPLKDKFFIDFFGYALIRIESLISKSGEGTSGQTELSRKKLVNDFFISYPKSEILQKEIVVVLDKLKQDLKSLNIIYSQKLKNLEELKKSLLEQAFSGELK